MEQTVSCKCTWRCGINVHPRDAVPIRIAASLCRPRVAGRRVGALRL